MPNHCLDSLMSFLALHDVVGSEEVNPNTHGLFNLEESWRHVSICDFLSRAMSTKRNADAIDENNQTAESDIFDSSPIEDRSSKFIAIFSPTISPKTLQAHDAFKSASHRILAWRKPSKQQSIGSMSVSSNAAKVIYDVGSDEDGEKYAGKKLEKLLVDMNIVGAVVVARWWGGIMLGQVRFDHILNTAKEAITSWQGSRKLPPPTKKMKTEASENLTPEEEAEQKARLAKQLTDRDASISVLRGLLAEKKVAKTGHTDDQNTPKATRSPKQVSTAKLDYLNMPIAKLRQLEKARDTTISWVLKQIDEVEASQSDAQVKSPS